MGHICDYKSVVTWSLCQPRVAQTPPPTFSLSLSLPLLCNANQAGCQLATCAICCNLNKLQLGQLVDHWRRARINRKQHVCVYSSLPSLPLLSSHCIHSPFICNPTAIQANRPKDDNKMRQHTMEAKNEAELEIPLVTNSPLLLSLNFYTTRPPPLLLRLPHCHNKTFLFDLNVSW